MKFCVGYLFSLFCLVDSRRFLVWISDSIDCLLTSINSLASSVFVEGCKVIPEGRKEENISRYL